MEGRQAGRHHAGPLNTINTSLHQNRVANKRRPLSCRSAPINLSPLQSIENFPWDIALQMLCCIQTSTTMNPPQISCSLRTSTFILVSTTERLKPNLYVQGLRTRIRLFHTILTYDNLDVGKRSSREDFMQASYLTPLSDALATSLAPLPSTMGAKAVEAHIIPA